MDKDESRALRDTLERTQTELRQSRESLARLRTHHAREQESLARQLEEARREVAALRARLAQASAPRAPEPTPAPAPSPPRPESYTSSTGLLALLHVPPSEDEETLGRLGRTLRLGLADLRLRLAAPPPVLLARLPFPEVLRVRDSLRAEGFSVVGCELPARTANPLRVRRFVLGTAGLRLEGERGERRDVAWTEPRLLVLGRRTVTTEETHTETVTESPHRGPRTREVTVRRDEVSPFLWLYGTGLWVAFTGETEFQGLGERRGLSALASLQALGQAVREHAPQVVWDERLMHTPRLALPLVDADRGHEVTGELLWRAVLDGPGPGAPTPR